MFLPLVLLFSVLKKLSVVLLEGLKFNFLVKIQASISLNTLLHALLKMFTATWKLLPTGTHIYVSTSTYLELTTGSTGDAAGT
jgi:hypothetical protein